LKLKFDKSMLKGWKGVAIYIPLGLLLAYFFGVRSVLFYALLCVGIPIIHFNSDEDTVLYLYLGAFSASLIYRGIGFVLGTDLPVVAVVSTSMLHDRTTPVVHYEWLEKNLGISKEEADRWPLSKVFDRGDILIVIGVDPEKIQTGDVIVFDAGQGYPVVHRVMLQTEDGGFRTKGDHNPSLDYWIVYPEDIHGKAVFVIPKLGYVKIIASELFYSLTRW